MTNTHFDILYEKNSDNENINDDENNHIILLPTTTFTMDVEENKCIFTKHNLNVIDSPPNKMNESHKIPKNKEQKVYEYNTRSKDKKPNKKLEKIMNTPAVYKPGKKMGPKTQSEKPP